MARGQAWSSSAIDGAPRWVSGVLAGVQAALLSFLVVVMPALAAYVATSADPANVDVGWPHAAGVGAALWLLGHGAVVHAGGAVVSVVPLGITALALFAGYASARRSAHSTVSAWLAGVGGYVTVVIGAMVLAGESGPLGAGGGSVLRLLTGTVVIAAAGLGAGVVRVRRFREVTRPVWSRLPAVARAGVTAGVMALGIVVGLAALLTCAWVVSGRAAAGDVVAGLGVDTFGGLLLAVAQLAVAPNLVVWALAWLAGPGFVVGAGTHYSPAEVVSGPLPALPLLGALPTADGSGGLIRWAPVVVVLAGMVAGWWLHRRLPVTRAWDSLAASLWAGATAGALAAVATAVAGGSVGPGRLAVVGGPFVLVGLSVLGTALLGVLLVAVPTDPVVRRAVAARLREAGRRIRGDAGLALSGDAGELRLRDADATSGVAADAVPGADGAPVADAATAGQRDRADEA